MILVDIIEIWAMALVLCFAVLLFGGASVNTRDTDVFMLGSIGIFIVGAILGSVGLLFKFIYSW